MRARGEEGVQTMNGDTIAKMYGVAKGTYDPVLLPSTKVTTITCTDAGPPDEVGARPPNVFQGSVPHPTPPPPRPR